VGPAILVRAALILLIFAGAIVTPTDADLWGHLAFGRDIVASAQPVQRDAYSFTTDRPWINHEWLAEVIFFEAYRAGGSVGLIILKLAIISALLICVWRYLRPLAAQDLGWLLIAATFVGTFWRTHNIRPQLFSVLLFALLLLCMRAADAGRRARLLFVPPLMALWVNMHGGWILGLAVYGIWAVARLTDRRESPWNRAFPLLIGVFAGAATILNPWGLELWTFLGETVRPARADIEEWSPITQYPLVLGIPWGLTLASAGLALWRGGPPRRLDYIGIVGLLSVLAFLVGRLDAFFTLAVVILLAPQFARLWKEDKPRDSPRPQASLVAITMVGILALIVPVARFAAPYSRCLPISGAWAPDAEAARFISENKLSGRMMTWFDWGQYVIWHFGPGLQVSMDGRRETVYSDAAIHAHRAFYSGDASAMPYLSQLRPDWIWLPVHLPVTKQLESAGWTRIFDGAISTIWSPSARGFQRSEPFGRSESRCFPGP
jgi:hypothetical protein